MQFTTSPSRTTRPMRVAALALAAAATLGITACSKSSSDLPAAAPAAPLAVVAPPPVEASAPVAPAPSRVVVAQNQAPVVHHTPRAERPLPPRSDRDEEAATHAQPRIAAAACPNCGVIESFSVVQLQGQTNGVGAVAGGLGGAVIGNRIAGGNNRTAGGIVGAIGGGLIGNEIEKHQRKSEAYDVHVRMEDGSVRTVRQTTSPTVGERVLVDGDALRARS